MRDLPVIWFSLSARVGRTAYLVSGLLLALLKFCGDDAMLTFATGRGFSPLRYLQPVYDARLPSAPDWVWMAMAAWALPFIFLGVSLTLRRLIDARLSPWLCLLFFVPYVNLALMLALCLVRRATDKPSRVETKERIPQLHAAIVGVAGGVLIGAVSALIQLYLLKSYNAAVFLGTPFVMGAVSGYVYNKGGERNGTTWLGALTIAVAALMTLLFAVEGVVCVAMALPLAAPLGMFGARIGRHIALERADTKPVALMLFLALSPLASLEKPPLREVRSSIEIDAPPERVWPHVVSFSELDEPPRWFFKLGIAYPLRATIHDRVRRCEFSTGAFVEPITAWDEPHRLAFDVASEPPPLTELSPYKHVHAEHLLTSFHSKRGEFRLIELPGGRTRLEGSTFYELAMGPQDYWAFYADALIHAIHQRVLEHIRSEVTH